MVIAAREKQLGLILYYPFIVSTIIESLLLYFILTEILIHNKKFREDQWLGRGCSFLVEEAGLGLHRAVSQGDMCGHLSHAAQLGYP